MSRAKICQMMEAQNDREYEVREYRRRMWRRRGSAIAEFVLGAGLMIGLWLVLASGPSLQ